MAQRAAPAGAGDDAARGMYEWGPQALKASGQLVSRREQLRTSLNVTALPEQNKDNGRGVVFNDAHVQWLLVMPLDQRRTQFLHDWCTLPEGGFVTEGARAFWARDHVWCEAPASDTVRGVSRAALKLMLGFANQKLPSELSLSDAMARELIVMGRDAAALEFQRRFCVPPPGGFATDADMATWMTDHDWCTVPAIRDAQPGEAATSSEADQYLRTMSMGCPAWARITDAAARTLRLRSSNPDLSPEEADRRRRVIDAQCGIASVRTAASFVGAMTLLPSTVTLLGGGAAAPKGGTAEGPPAPPPPRRPLPAPVLGNPLAGVPVVADADVSFNWGAVEGARSYEFRLCLDADLQLGCISGDGGGLMLTGLSVTMRVPAGSYFWSVRATGSDGTPGILAEARTLRAVAPAQVPAPTLISPPDAATAIAGTVIPFAWGPVSGARGYALSVCTDPGMTQSCLPTGGGSFTSDTSQSIAAPVGDYFWNVRAVGDQGTLGAISETRHLSVRATGSSTTQATTPATLLASLGLTCAEWSVLTADDQQARLALLLPPSRPSRLGDPSEAPRINPIPGQIVAINAHCQQERTATQRLTTAPPAVIRRSPMVPILLVAGAVGVVGLGWWMLRDPTPAHR